jgi:hypothetical protein
VKKLATLLIAVLALAITPVANADSLAYEVVSGDDRSQPAGMNYRFSAKSISMQIFESNRSEIIIKVFFAQALGPNGLMNYTSSLQNNVPVLRVKFMNELETYKGQGDTGNLWLESPRSVPYQGSTKLNAAASIYANPSKGADGGRTYLTGCYPKTWMADGASSEWVAFSVDRSCAGLADQFWLNVYFDSNINSAASTLDYKYLPTEPIFVNLKNVPKAPVMKNQTVAFVGFIPTQNLDNPKVTSYLTSSLSLPVTVNSLTPTVCITTLNGLALTTSLLKTGTCTLEAFALGNDLTNPSPRVQQSFTVNPKVMIEQDLTWNKPGVVTVGDDSFDLRLKSSSGLPVVVTSDSPNICQFNDPSNPSWVTIISSGTCYLTARAPGTDKYFEKSGTANFWVDPKPVVTPTKKAPTPTPSTTREARAMPTPTPTRATTITITSTVGKQEKVTTRTDKNDLSNNSKKVATIYCKKGSKTSPVKGVNPKCPAGSTKVNKP